MTLVNDRNCLVLFGVFWGLCLGGYLRDIAWKTQTSINCQVMPKVEEHQSYSTQERCQKLRQEATLRILTWQGFQSAWLTTNNTSKTLLQSR